MAPPICNDSTKQSLTIKSSYFPQLPVRKFFCSNQGKPGGMLLVLCSICYYVGICFVVCSNIFTRSLGKSEDEVEFGSSKYFALCGLGGIISCGTTHTAIVPLDLVKCRIQVNPEKYKGIIHGFRTTVKEEGFRALAKGWAPTFVGYSLQGLGKFGFYELFKILYSDMLGEELSYQWRTSLYLAASASAEFFADILLAPMEATKVRVQTSPGAPPTLRGCAPMIYRTEGMLGFYKGLPPLWMRQIPYTMMKFACFERTLEALYKYVVPKPRSECTKQEQLVVTFVAGYIAGVFCAIVSHPADTIVSKLNQDSGSSATAVAKKLGFVGLWKGLVPRIIMIGTLTALQWFIYDSVKVYFKLPRPPPPEMPLSLRKKLEAAGKIRERMGILDQFSDIARNKPFHVPLVRKGTCARYQCRFFTAPGEVPYGSLQFFALCGIGGVISCGTTHTAIVPLDLVKCRIQVNPTKYRGIVSSFGVTLREEGFRALGKGWAPTFVGYSLQGLGKFGFYEVFKLYYSELLGEERAYKWRTSLYLAASASAEFFADVMLAPMEATKVRIQTAPGAPPTLRRCAPMIWRQEGISGFYKGLPPLWMRQIPYTMMKFACFERTVEMLYKYVVPKPRSQCSKSEQLAVTFCAGYIAGIFCAIVSHPADTVVSKLNQDASSGAWNVAKKLGFVDSHFHSQTIFLYRRENLTLLFVGLWKGLLPRIIMIGTLTAAQWFIYDSVKVVFKLPRPPPPEMPDSLKAKLKIMEKV
ncbi:unnamed protein product [Thelazia callipaeda]|uniref:Phosphate carrier protein, mitochondrial n=1 Tax=Thelazia callipaeda TaxID=103827 RepID=A0A0N5CV34_THECL|nr:unnamed protein product [Thelazia callipaeda]